jgi:hypothetical protein
MRVDETRHALDDTRELALEHRSFVGRALWLQMQ